MHGPDQPLLTCAPVLFAEDDASYAILAQYAWSKTGTNVPLKWVNDGKEAVQYLRGTAPATDPRLRRVPRMILTDFHLPCLSGLEVLSWVRHKQIFRNLPVVVLSGSGSKKEIEDAYALGASLYLEKPHGLAQTIEMMRSLDRYWLEKSDSTALRRHDKVLQKHTHSN
jgi:two-component system response regulator